ncbi:MAG: hypothetical protein CMN76_07745 [Spirochaetaceae bacterium]|nr:hypothetical protein [Spirochaetaceae bacterium]
MRTIQTQGSASTEATRPLLHLSRSISLLGILAISLGILHQASELSGSPDEGPKPHAIPEELKIENRILTPGQAMKGLFGHWNESTQKSAWIMPPMKRDPRVLDFRSPERSQPVETTVVARDVATKRQVILLLATLPEGDSYECRICAPLISVAWFVQKDEFWHLRSHEFLRPLGSYATPPAVSIIEIGQGTRAFELTTSDLAQGISTTAVHWLAPIPEKNRYDVLFEYVSSRANDGQCSPPEFPCEHTSRKVDLIKSKKSYYDLKLVERQSSTAHSEIKSRTYRYFFDGLKYRRLSR